MGWKDEAQKRVKQKTSGMAFKPIEGDNTIRILPNKAGKDEKPYLEYMTHREVGPDKRQMRCGKDTEGNGKCWLCDKVISPYEGSNNRAKQEMAAEMKAKDMIVYQVSVVGSDGKFSAPKPWYLNASGPRSLGVSLLSLISRSKRAYDDPKKGFNISISRTGQGKNDTRYGPFEVDESSSEVPKEILKQMKELEELAGKYSDVSQKDTFGGKRITDDDEDADEDRNKKKSGDEDEDDDEPPKKKKPADDEDDIDDDDDDADDDDGDEDEDEEPPKKKKKPADDEDDEDDEDADDEDADDDDADDDDGDEDDEPPKKKKKSADADEDDEDADEDDDEDGDEDEDDDEPPKKKKPAQKKPVKKKK